MLHTVCYTTQIDLYLYLVIVSHCFARLSNNAIH
jgi:hypothetical protein